MSDPDKSGQHERGWQCPTARRTSPPNSAFSAAFCAPAAAQPRPAVAGLSIAAGVGPGIDRRRGRPVLLEEGLAGLERVGLQARIKDG